MHEHLVPGVEQRFGEVAADEACSACNQICAYAIHPVRVCAGAVDLAATHERLEPIDDSRLLVVPQLEIQRQSHQPIGHVLGHRALPGLAAEPRPMSDKCSGW